MGRQSSSASLVVNGGYRSEAEKDNIGPMFGMGMGEILLIAVVALLVLGPDRLPGAAKAIGKGIRDLRSQTKGLQATIEQDTHIGEAVRELRGALRGDPESLYKRATGEDFNAPEAENGETDEAADPNAVVSTDDLAHDPWHDDEEYSNSDDAWGDDAVNPHEQSDESARATPIIKAADGAIARGTSSPAESSPVNPTDSSPENPAEPPGPTSNDSKNDDTKNG